MSQTNIEYLYGTLARNIYRNEKTAFRFFLMTDENGETVSCAGKIQHLPIGICLRLAGRAEEDVNGNKRFSFTNYEILDSCEEKEITLIENLRIEDLNRRIAKKFVSYFGKVLSTVKDTKTASAFENRCPDAIKPFAKPLYNKLKKVFIEKDMFDEILLKGGNYSNVKSILSKYGTFSLKKLRENPYLVGVRCGLEFFVCEAVAKEQDIHPLSKMRAAGVLYYAMKNVVANGDTYATASDIKKAINKLLKNQQLGPLPSEYVLALAVLDNEHFVIYNNHIYFRHLWNSQYTLVNHIERLLKNKNNFEVKKEDILFLEEREGIRLSPSQQAAFSVFESYGIKVITGGPGAGKTTLTNLLIQYFREKYPNETVCLCAPTGCAAQNLALKTDTEAATIHKTLGIKPCSADALQTTIQLSAKLYIIDEASMLDLELASILFSNIPSNTFVLLIGDADQLPSVGTGSLLSDLINAGIESYRLEGTFRQMNGSAIVSNAYAINDSKYDNIKEAEDFNIIEVKTDADIIDTVLFAADEPETEWQVLTPMRKSMLGSIEMGLKLQGQLTFASNLKKDYGKITFHIGDKVLTVHNNYSAGYYNGEQGVVTGISEDGILITFDDGSMIDVSNSELSDVMLSYAMTIHKSQGAEYENVIIVLPASADIMCSKNLLYTAVTRAKKRVIIISQRGQLKRTVCKMQRPRNSELSELIRMRLTKK